MAEQILDSKQVGKARNISYLCTKHCQCLPSFLLTKDDCYSSRGQTSSTTNSLLMKQDLGNTNTAATRTTTVLEREFKVSSSTSNGSSLGGGGAFQVQGLLKHDDAQTKSVSFVPRNQVPPPPLDKHSETVGHGSQVSGQYYHDQTSNSAANGHNHDHNQPFSESSSVCCSIGATSHNTNLSSIDDSSYLSDNDEEPEEGVMEDKLAQEGTGVKRSRSASNHNKRKRRDNKINKKMRILKELIPNCNEINQASILDDAIEHVKTLKFQLQIMSMGLSMPFMMLPTSTNNMINFNTPHLPDNLMGSHGMGFWPGTGMIPYGLLPQSYPIALNDNGVWMFGQPANATFHS